MNSCKMSIHSDFLIFILSDNVSVCCLDAVSIKMCGIPLRRSSNYWAMVFRVGFLNYGGAVFRVSGFGF